MHDNGVEKQVRPKTWNPWADTILYMPLKSDLLDHSGNNIQFTQVWTITLDSEWANFGNKSWLTWDSPSIISGDFTFSSWINPTTAWTGANIILIGQAYPWRWYRYGSNNSAWYIWFTLTSVIDWSNGRPFSALYWWWHNLVLTRRWTTNTMYVDNVVLGSYNWTSTPSSTQIIVWSHSQDPIINLEWHVNEIIIEWVWRTATDVVNYYNLTKWNYWL